MINLRDGRHIQMMDARFGKRTIRKVSWVRCYVVYIQCLPFLDHLHIYQYTLPKKRAWKYREVIYLVLFFLSLSRWISTVYLGRVPQAWGKSLMYDASPVSKFGIYIKYHWGKSKVNWGESPNVSWGKNVRGIKYDLWWFNIGMPN